jgi:hypothetical protein
MIKTRVRPLSVYILISLMAFQGLSGILGGTALVLDPTGNALQMPLTLLEGSPFDDYFIPGLILLVILGIFPLVVLIGVVRGRTTAWLGSIVIGLALLVWIGVEIFMIGYHNKPPLQLIYGVVGFLILVFTLLRPTRRYFVRSSG